MGKMNRIVICGLKSIGKTSLIEQSVYGSVHNNQTDIFPTIEDIYTANIETDRGTREKFHIYDTAGFDLGAFDVNSENSQYSTLARHFAHQADCFIFVYEVSTQESLDCIISFKYELDKLMKDKKEVVLVMFAHDLKRSENSSGHVIPNAMEWCNREKIKHFEVDAFKRQSLHEPFIYIATKLNPVPNRSSFPQLSMVRKTVKNEFG